MGLLECAEGEEAGLRCLAFAVELFFEVEEVVGEGEILGYEGLEGSFRGGEGGVSC